MINSILYDSTIRRHHKDVGHYTGTFASYIQQYIINEHPQHTIEFVKINRYSTKIYLNGKYKGKLNDRTQPNNSINSIKKKLGL